MSTRKPIQKIRPRSGLGERTNQKLKLELDWLQTATIDKTQRKLHGELVMIWISPHGFTP